MRVVSPGRSILGCRLLFVALAGQGQANPPLPLVEEFVRRGHRVNYAATTVGPRSSRDGCGTVS
ncbi:MAG: hypothetical protein JO281_10265 [Pseudonocardiales bacterium]|nr:hypothetical protein [Pseudonocardiales bacterium]